MAKIDGVKSPISWSLAESLVFLSGFAIPGPCPACAWGAVTSSSEETIKEPGQPSQYGKQWNTKVYADKVVIGNRASYAQFVGGDKQPIHMHTKGWRVLANVARMKIPVIRRIYERWIARGLKRAGFK